MAMKQDVEFFFGLGSVAYAVSQSLTGSVSSGKSKTSFSELLQYKPKMLKRILNAKKICKKEKRELLPKDLFHLKGFMVAGTDNKAIRMIWRKCGEFGPWSFLQERNLPL